MPLNNQRSVLISADFDTSALEARLAAIEAINAQQASAIAALQAGSAPSQSISSGEDEMQNWQLRTSNYTAQNRDRVIADTTASAWTLTLPPSAVYGHEVEVLIDGANTLTLDPNGANLNGAATALDVTSDRAKLAIVYRDDARGWIVGAGTAASTPPDEGGGETPPPSGSPVGVEYVVTQSSFYQGSSAQGGTYAKLHDGDGSTGAACDGGTQWIQATFPSSVNVSAVTVGGGFLPNFGEVAFALNNAKIQYSLDNATWVDAATVSGVDNSGANQFKKITLPSTVAARYWRLHHTYYLATTELRFE